MPWRTLPPFSGRGGTGAWLWGDVCRARDAWTRLQEKSADRVYKGVQDTESVCLLSTTQLGKVFKVMPQEVHTQLRGAHCLSGHCLQKGAINEEKSKPCDMTCGIYGSMERHQQHEHTAKAKCTTTPDSFESQLTQRWQSGCQLAGKDLTVSKCDGTEWKHLFWTCSVNSGVGFKKVHNNADRWLSKRWH